VSFIDFIASASALNFFRCLFLSFGRFWIVAVDVSVKFYEMYLDLWLKLLSFVQKIQNGGCRHLGVLFGNTALDHP